MLEKDLEKGSGSSFNTAARQSLVSVNSGEFSHFKKTAEAQHLQKKTNNTAGKM